MTAPGEATGPQAGDPRARLAPSVEAPPPPKFTVDDAAMILLALVSVSFVIGDLWFRPALVRWGVFTYVVYADAAITFIFLIEFLVSARKFGSLAGYAKENWYDVVGMAPMAAFLYLEAIGAGVTFSAALAGSIPESGAAGGAGALRLFRFVRIIRILVAGSRLMRATNMTFGEQVVNRVFAKYQRVIVERLTTPILVQSLGIAQQTVGRMRYAESVGRAIDSKRDEIHQVVVETLEKNRVPSQFLTQPLIDRIVLEVEKQVVNHLVSTLMAERLNELIQQMLVQVLEDFKLQLQGKAPAASPAASLPATPAQAGPQRVEVKSG